MGKELLGTEVAASMKIELIREVEALKEKGILPHLTIIRVGAREDDLAYERGALKRMELTGISCSVLELPEDITQEAFDKAFTKVNDDPQVHGILLFRPLPKHLSEEYAKEIIHPLKDVDGMCDRNLGKIFLGDASAHVPCTAQAVIEMMNHFGVDLTGKKVTVVGRSLVVGKPLSMLLLNRNATVKICHTRTKDLRGECADADILCAAAGKARMITADMVKEGAYVFDVGINVDEEGNLCGDVDYDEVAEKAAAITPVPRGVGSVTTSVLAKQVVQAAKLLHS